MTPRPSRLWWLSGLAGAALTLNAQPSPVSTPPSAPTEKASASLASTPRLVVAGNANDPWDGPIDAPTLPLKLLLPIVEKLTDRIVLPAQGLPNPDLPIVFKATPTKGELLQAIETVLTMNQLALVPLGPKFLKVVPLGNARIEAPALLEESTLTLPPSGQIAAKLFSLQFLRAGEFVPQVSNLLNPGSGSPPVIFEKANAVLITDSISTLQRIEQIIAKTDGPTASGMQAKFYTLTNGAKASDIVNKLRTFLQPLQAQIGSGTSYNADDRTNQIILFGDPRQFPLFDELIAKLDVKSDPNTRNEVIPLKHADATEVATLLNTLITGQTRAAQASGSAQTNNRANQGRNPGAPTTPDTPPAPNVPTPTGPMIDVGAASNEFSSLVNLQPDVRSNAIVASGTVDDMRLIKALVEKLDIVLPQVRIEVVIAEVTLSDQASSGISQLGLNVQNGKLVGFNAAAPGISVGGATATDPANGLTGFATFNDARDLTGIINLSTTPRKNNNSILSVPSISVMHNKEGIVFIGETRPVISGSTTNPTSSSTNGGFSTSSTVTQQEIGTKVTVKPLIGYDGSVQMEIKQDITDVAGTVIVDGNEQYVISKRTTESFITAKSGEILVLSGLQKRSNNKTSSRLGPIPIIGDLLGSRSRREDRTELVFFLRPTVLTNTPADNVQAMRQIELMPNRDAVKKTLSPTGTINDDKVPAKDGPVLNRKK
jgi:general secretion pathway protein D